jgi:hypothetical protein
VVASLSEEIGLDVIERMKEAVAVKKWALPDREPPKLLEGSTPGGGP